MLHIKCPFCHPTNSIKTPKAKSNSIYFINWDWTTKLYWPACINSTNKKLQRISINNNLLNNSHQLIQNMTNYLTSAKSWYTGCANKKQSLEKNSLSH